LAVEFKVLGFFDSPYLYSNCNIFITSHRILHPDGATHFSNFKKQSRVLRPFLFSIIWR